MDMGNIVWGGYDDSNNDNNIEESNWGSSIASHFLILWSLYWLMASLSTWSIKIANIKPHFPPSFMLSPLSGNISALYMVELTNSSQLSRPSSSTSSSEKASRNPLLHIPFGGYPQNKMPWTKRRGNTHCSKIYFHHRILTSLSTRLVFIYLVWCLVLSCIVYVLTRYLLSVQSRGAGSPE